MLDAVAPPLNELPAAAGQEKVDADSDATIGGVDAELGKRLAQC
ncbi:hypothetical protein [Xanthomonas maliensis]|nr:hypothetical protein [Xanthomonas maliensis]